MHDTLSQTFSALADPTRRAMLARLSKGEANVSDLARPFLKDMSLPAVTKHLQVLERAGLVVTQKVGRVRTCRLGTGGLAAEAAWIEARRQLFEARFDALDEIISEMKLEENDGSAS